MAKKKKVNLFANRPEEDDTRVSDKSYLDDFIPKEESKSVVAPKLEPKVKNVKEVGEEEPKIKRATMVVWEEDIQTFRDIIHTIKRSGDYQYTQKDAFHQAIELLKGKVLEKYESLEEAPPPRKGRW